VLTFRPVRVVIDYRSALTSRSGVGEYTHQLVKALLEAFPPGVPGTPFDLTIFSSSWRDRLRPDPDLRGAAVVDRRVPVRVLNFLWHRLQWPPVERLGARGVDVAHSMHPLLLPTRRAARVVTIYDLHFLTHPERTHAEIRRDYPALARAHAHRADAIVTISAFTACEIERRLQVPIDRVEVCPPGAPDWPARRTPPPGDAYLLFLGTLEPRKNVGALLDAYETLLARRQDLPPLVLAGHAGPQARPWLERLERRPLAGHVRATGYVQSGHRRALYEGARLIVQPSFEEGFGMAVLEAMALGLPVVAANRGALPEVLGDAGLLVEPEADAIAGAIARLLDDEALAGACASKGVEGARRFRWADTARAVHRAYVRALERHG
jgi:glycosyltransferase involved in cell wall biosynthesis